MNDILRPEPASSTHVDPDWEQPSTRGGYLEALGRAAEKLPASKSLLPSYTEFAERNELPTLSDVPEQVIRLGSDILNIPTRALGSLREDQPMSMTDPDAMLFRPETDAVKRYMDRSLPEAGVEDYAGLGPVYSGTSSMDKGLINLLTEMIGGIASDPMTYAAGLMTKGGQKMMKGLAEDQSGSIRAFHGSPDPDLKPVLKATKEGTGHHTLGSGFYSASDPVSGTAYAGAPGRTLYEVDLHPGKKPKEHRYIDYQQFQKDRLHPPRDFVEMNEALVNPEALRIQGGRLLSPSSLPVQIAASNNPVLNKELLEALEEGMGGRPEKYRALVEKITGGHQGGLHSKYKGELELAENQIRDFLQTKGYAGARGSMSNVVPSGNFPGVELATFDPTDIRVVNKWPAEEIPDVWLKKMRELW